MTTNYKFGQNVALENLWIKFHDHPEGRWIMKIQSALRLYDLIKKYQPTQILELGTGIGCGTAIMATAIDNAKIMTVEQNQKCIDIAKELIPYELKQNIHFEYCPVGLMKAVDPFRSWSAFVAFQWNFPDLIVVDGPGPFMLKGDLVNLPNGDIINFLWVMKPGTKIYVDGRKEAVALYKRFLQWYLDILEESDDHILFERNNRQLAEDLSDFRNSDTVRGDLEALGYFK